MFVYVQLASTTQSCAPPLLHSLFCEQIRTSIRAKGAVYSVRLTKNVPSTAYWTDRKFFATMSQALSVTWLRSEERGFVILREGRISSHPTSSIDRLLRQAFISFSLSRLEAGLRHTSALCLSCLQINYLRSKCVVFNISIRTGPSSE